MDPGALLQGVTNPPVLFFFLGLLAILLRSDLEIPQPIPKLLSLYLLLAIGFKGGAELRHAGFTMAMAGALLAAMLFSCSVPAIHYFLMRSRLGSANAAAVAATYGSVSAVTFITATSMLQSLKIDFGGHMVAALALMESPAIIVAVALHRLQSAQGDPSPSPPRTRWRAILEESFLNGSVFLLMGSMAIGVATGQGGVEELKPFVSGIFKGMLCLFLLDLGIVSGRRLSDLRKFGASPIVFALATPLAQALLGILMAWSLNLGVGDAFLLCVLCASASYIAVPAALRHSIPEANPGLYVAMSLGVTFPLNILIGLPAYLAIIQFVWR